MHMTIDFRPDLSCKKHQSMRESLGENDREETEIQLEFMCGKFDVVGPTFFLAFLKAPDNCAVNDFKVL